MKKIICLLAVLVLVNSIQIGSRADGIELIGKKYTFGDNLCGASTQEFGEIIYVGKAWIDKRSPYKYVLIKYTRDGAEVKKLKLLKARDYAPKSQPRSIMVVDDPRWSKRYTTRFHFSRKK